MDINLNNLLKSMAKAYEPQEEEFAFTETLFILQKTCPIHHVGFKSLTKMRYICPICKNGAP